MNGVLSESELQNWTSAVFHDSYKEKIEALIKSKMRGEVAQVLAKKPKKAGQEHHGGAEEDGGIVEVTSG